MSSELTVYLRHAKRSSEAVLELSDRGLEFIPRQVFTIRTIEVLNLASNRLTSIEAAITDLVRLRTLNLEDNLLAELPEQLTSLPKLNTLRLKGNPLKDRFVCLLSEHLQAGPGLLRALQQSFRKTETPTAPVWLSESNEYQESPLKRIAPVISSKTPASRRQERKVFVKPENKQVNGVLEIQFSELSIGKEISRGGFSTIHVGSYFGSEVAVKKVFNPNISEQLLQQFHNQIKILAKYRHPQIVLLLGAVTTPPNLCLVMEYVRAGSLYDTLHKRRATLNLQARTKIAKQILRVLEYLHKHSIVHRDIKSHNVLLDANYNIKICDFGLSRHQSELNLGPVQFSGTPAYMSQELFEKRAYTESVDIFAVGTLLYELFTGELVYAGLEPADIKERVLKDSTLPNRGNISRPLLELVNLCRGPDPESRPNVSALVAFSEWGITQKHE